MHKLSGIYAVEGTCPFQPKSKSNQRIIKKITFHGGDSIHQNYMRERTPNIDIVDL
jgi:hypothetical protein